MLDFRLTKRAIESRVFANWKQGVMTPPVLDLIHEEVAGHQATLTMRISDYSWLAQSSELYQSSKKSISVEVYSWGFCRANAHKVKWSTGGVLWAFSHEVMWPREFVPAISRKRDLAAITFSHMLSNNSSFCMCVTLPALACSSVCGVAYVCTCVNVGEKQLVLIGHKPGGD